MKTQFTKTLTACMIAATFAIALPAHVESSNGSKASASSLDLTDPADASALYERIVQAARIICTDTEAPWDGRRVHYRKLCIADVVEDTVDSFNRPLLTAIHRQSSEQVASRGDWPQSREHRAFDVRRAG